MGLGITLAAVTGFVPLLAGGAFLESGYIEVDIPLIGEVKAVSALAFDLGVYLAVVGMALSLVRSLGEAGLSEPNSGDDT
jgi:multisubunit Na+/H+ antiporter MnhB subunit